MGSDVYPALRVLGWSSYRLPTHYDLEPMEAASGKEVRLSLAVYPRYKYRLRYNILRAGGVGALLFDSITGNLDTAGTDWDSLGGAQQELEAIEGFYLRRAGRWDDWLYDDPDDDSVTNAQFGVGDGQATQFQLTRPFGGIGGSFALLSDVPSTVGSLITDFATLSSGATHGGFVEAIQNLNGAPAVFINGAATTAFTVDPLGVVSFTTAPHPGDKLSWTGNFFWRCRFLEDYVAFTNFMNKLWSAELSFITVKL